MAALTVDSENTVDQHQQMTWQPKSSLTMETSHWTSSNMDSVPIHSSSRLWDLDFQMKCKIYFHLKRGLWTTELFFSTAQVRQSKTNSIVKDPTHPSHSLFQLLPSGRRYRSIRARSARLLNSFFPQAVRALNSDHPAPLWNPCKPLPPETRTPPPPPSPLQTPPQPYYTKEKTVNFFCAIQVCYTQVSGPVQTTCSNTLSSMRTRHFS